MKKLLLLCLLTGLVFLLGCKKLSEEMIEDYRKGSYVLAAQKASEALKDSAQRPEVILFLNTQGHALFLKIFETIQTEVKDSPTEASLITLKSVERVLSECFEQGVSFDGINDIRSRFQALNTETLERFYVANVEAAKKDAEMSLFRSALSRYEMLGKYAPISVKDRLTMGGYKQKASKGLAIEQIKPVFEPLQLETINIPKESTRLFFEQLTREKSKFLQLTLLESSDWEDSNDYKLAGDIDAVVEQDGNLWNPSSMITKQDTLFYTTNIDGRQVENRSTFEYFVYTVQYRVRVTLTLRVFEVSTQKLYKTWTLQKIAHKQVTFRSKPVYLPPLAASVSYPQAYLDLPDALVLDKQAVIREALLGVVKEGANEVLKSIDKDGVIFPAESHTVQ